MISYARTSWYGVGYFFIVNGSALPRCMPPAALAMLVTWLFREDGGNIISIEELGHPYIFQLVGIGTLPVCRTRGPRSCHIHRAADAAPRLLELTPLQYLVTSR